MWRSLARLLGERSGAESVEFALVGFAFFLMLFGIFELGRLASAQGALAYGTSVAARYAAVHGSRSSSPASATMIAARFVDAVQPVLGAAAPTPSVSYAPDNSPGSTVTVAAIYAWSPLSMGASFASVDLSARSSLVIEH